MTEGKKITVNLSFFASEKELIYNGQKVAKTKIFNLINSDIKEGNITDTLIIDNSKNDNLELIWVFRYNNTNTKTPKTIIFRSNKLGILAEDLSFLNKLCNNKVKIQKHSKMIKNYKRTVQVIATGAIIVLMFNSCRDQALYTAISDHRWLINHVMDVNDNIYKDSIIYMNKFGDISLPTFAEQNAFNDIYGKYLAELKPIDGLQASLAKFYADVKLTNKEMENILANYEAEYDAYLKAWVEYKITYPKVEINPTEAPGHSK